MPLEINPATFKKAIKSPYNTMLLNGLLVSFQKKFPGNGAAPPGNPQNQLMTLLPRQFQKGIGLAFQHGGASGEVLIYDFRSFPTF